MEIEPNMQFASVDPSGPANREFVPEKFFYSQVKKLKAVLNPIGNDTNVFERLAKDQELLAFLVLSPSHLVRLEKYFEKESQRCALLTDEAKTVEALAVIKCAVRGVTLHFGDGGFERGWISMMRALDMCLEESYSENVGTLRKKIQSVGNILLGAKNRIENCERSVYNLTSFAFAREYGLSTTFMENCCNFGGQLKGMIFGSEVRNIFIKSKKNSGFKQLIRNSNYYVSEVWWAMLKICCSAYKPLEMAFNLCVFLYGFVGFFNISAYMFRGALRYHLGSHYQRYLVSLVIGSITLSCGILMVRRRNAVVLQGASKEKKFMGVLAFCVTVMYMFDVDLAEAFGSNVSKIARLVSLYADDYRGFAAPVAEEFKGIATILQSGISTSDLSIVQNTMSVLLKIDESGDDDESVVADHEQTQTFKQWVNANELAGRTLIRPLQYTCTSKYALNVENVEDLARRMCEDREAAGKWSQVVGHTGSGKSTRLPVAYYNHLCGLFGRPKQILVCQPTQAATVNVVGGISANFGRMVFGKHEKWENLGDRCIQVMTYGSALACHAHDNTFLRTFDAVFLDESHLITEHALVFESVCNEFRNLRKFYVSATPRDGEPVPEARRQFEIDVTNSECNSVDQFIGSQVASNSLYVLKHETVLVFLAGKSECINAAIKWNKEDRLGMTAFSLTKDNFARDYHMLMERLKTERTIIFCTNILETGVTMNVDCVVDFGWTMRPELDLVEKTIVLKRKRVSDNERKQRIGRAGRLKEGFAIACGKTETRSCTVPPETLYGAAVLSFVHGVQFYMNDKFEREWVTGITKAQARVMTQFKVSPFLMKDLVREDGSMNKAVIKTLKDYARNVCDLVGTDAGVLPSTYQSWPKYRSLVSHLSRGEEKVPAALLHARVPFIVATTPDLPWEKLAEICYTFQPRVVTVFSGSDTSSRVLNLQLNKHGIMTSMEFVKGLLKEYRRSLVNLRRVKDNFDQSIFVTRVFSKSPNTRLKERIKLLEDNIQVLNQTYAKLEVIAFSDGSEIPMDARSVDEITEMVELQAKENLSNAELQRILRLSKPMSSFQNVILERGKAALAWLFVSIAAALIYLVFFMRPETQEEVNIQLEGKGKTYRNRDKRMGYPTNEEEEARDYMNKKVKKHSKKASLVRDAKPEGLRSVKKDFVNFYDLKTDANVLQAIFRTSRGQHLLTTNRPLADIARASEALWDHLRRTTQPLAGYAWADVEEDEGEDNKVVCELTMKDGRRFEIDMAQHDSDLLTADGATQGFVQHDNMLRQVGQTRVLGNEPGETSYALEASTAKAMTQTTVDAQEMVGFIKIGDITMNCVLYGDWIVTPAHIQQPKPNQNGRVVIILPHITYETTIQDIINHGIKQFNGVDIVAIRRPSHVRPVKKRMGAKCLTETTEIQMLYCSIKTGRHHFTLSDKCFKQPSGRWAHTISTTHGMCGCLVFEPSTNNFVGIHTAHNFKTKKNEFQSLSKEVVAFINGPGHKPDGDFVWKFIQEECGYFGQVVALQGFRAEIDEINRNAEGFGFKLKFQEVREPSLRAESTFHREFPDTAFRLIGEVKKGLIEKHTIVGENPYFLTFLSENPKFSWVHDFMDDYAPSVLAYDAYFKDLKKYDRPPHPRIFDQEVLNKAKDKMIQILEESGMKKCLVRTDEQVLRDVQWTTSSGPLYQGKKVDLVEHLTDGELVAFSRACHKNLLDGGMHGVWNGSLKAELRTVEKVYERKTRVFTAAPLTSLLAMKYYVDHFNKQFYTTHLKAPHTVGINKFNRGWEKLYEKLNRPGWLHGSGDGSRFDSSIDNFLFDVVKDIRKHFLDVEHHAAIEIIYDEIVNTKICLANGLIIQKSCGNNSGQPSTVVDNTLVLMVSFLYAYARLTGDHKYEQLDRNFVFVCNGDDNKFAISPDFYKKFGGDFSPFLKELGLKYEFDEITTDICENPYMSLTMVRTKFGIGFSLALERIVAILQWSRPGGVLHAYLSGIAAQLESFNTPFMYNMVETYLLWLIDNHFEEIIALMDLKQCYMLMPTGMDVMDLHYLERDVAAEEPQEFIPDINVDKLGNGDVIFLQSGTGNPPAIITTGGEKKKEKESENSGAIVTSDGSGSGSGAKWTMPKVTPKSFGFKTKIKIDTIASVPENFMETYAMVATETQRRKWVDAVRNDFGITDDDTWDKLLCAACVYFADNGTSENFDEDQKMEIRDGLNNLTEVPIRSFVYNARKIATLRRIMRCYSLDTRLLFIAMRRVPHWAVKHGSIDEVVFDFMIPDQFTSKRVLLILKETKSAAIGTETTNTLLPSETNNLKRTETRRRNDYDGHEEALRR